MPAATSVAVHRKFILINGIVNPLKISFMEWRAGYEKYPHYKEELDKELMKLKKQKKNKQQLPCIF